MLSRILLLLLIAPAASGRSTADDHFDRLQALFYGLAPQSDFSICAAELAPQDAATMRKVEQALNATPVLEPEDHVWLANGYRRLAVRQLQRLQMLADSDPMILHFIYLMAAPADEWTVTRIEFREAYGYPAGLEPVGEVLRHLMSLRHSTLEHLEKQYAAAFHRDPQQPRKLKALGRLLGDHRNLLPYLKWLNDRYLLLTR